MTKYLQIPKYVEKWIAKKLKEFPMLDRADVLGILEMYAGYHVSTITDQEIEKITGWKKGENIR